MSYSTQAHRVTPVIKKPSDCLRAAVRGTLLREFDLTPRPIEILERYVEGDNKHKIAEELRLSVRTVEDHEDDLKQALGVRDRAQLVAFWTQLLYQTIDTLGFAISPQQYDRHDSQSSEAERNTGKIP